MNTSNGNRQRPSAESGIFDQVLEEQEAKAPARALSALRAVPTAALKSTVNKLLYNAYECMCVHVVVVVACKRPFYRIFSASPAIRLNYIKTRVSHNQIPEQTNT